MKRGRSMSTGLAAVLATGALMICGAVVSCAGPSRAHDAQPTAAQPQGWAYPLACCSGYDCREVGAGTGSPIRIRETPAGYEISTTGEVIPMLDARVKNSPDGLFHLCCRGGRFETCDVLCLFAPPRGF